MRNDRSGASVALGNESVADTSSGSSGPPTPASSVASTEQVGRLGQRRQRPREVEREEELVGGLLVVGEADEGVLEAEQDTRVDLEREVEVDRAFAPFFGVQVDLPRLAQRVRLDEMTLVVHVESVLDRVILQIGDEPGNVDDGQSASLLEGANARDS